MFGAQQLFSRTLTWEEKLHKSEWPPLDLGETAVTLKNPWAKLKGNNWRKVLASLLSFISAPPFSFFFTSSSSSFWSLTIRTLTVHRLPFDPFSWQSMPSFYNSQMYISSVQPSFKFINLIACVVLCLWWASGISIWDVRTYFPHVCSCFIFFHYYTCPKPSLTLYPPLPPISNPWPSPITATAKHILTPSTSLSSTAYTLT